MLRIAFAVRKAHPMSTGKKNVEKELRSCTGSAPKQEDTMLWASFCVNREKKLRQLHFTSEAIEDLWRQRQASVDERSESSPFSQLPLHICTWLTTFESIWQQSVHNVFSTESLSSWRIARDPLHPIQAAFGMPEMKSHDVHQVRS